MNKSELVKKERIASAFFAAFLLIGIAILYIFISLSLGDNKLYGFGVFISLIPFTASLKFYFKRKNFKTMINLREQWGQEVKRKRDFKSIKKLFDNLAKNEKDFLIDDQTWFDLDMDKVFSKLDRTLSTPGQHYLYYMLRKPEFRYELLKKRGDKIKYFQQNVEQREEIELLLHKIGTDYKKTIVDFIWDKIDYSTKMKPLVYIMTMAAIGAIILGFTKGAASAVLPILLVYCINYYIHSKTKKMVGTDISSIGYLGKVLSSAQKISKMQNGQVFEEYSNELKKNIEKCNSIMKKSLALQMSNTEGMDMIIEYINIFLLNQARTFFQVIDDINKNIDSIKQIYLLIGEIDSIISIASYREKIKYIEPTFVDGSKSIDVENIIHPLLEKPINNSLDMRRNIIITGSNMSGKSTFLRTIGVNALFSQTIYTCTASKYKGDFFRVVTSISVSDNISSGKSYYMGEAEALYRIIKNTNAYKYPILTLIDEIFRGTNPIERINAASEILKYLSQNNSLVMVATHDLEITNMVDDMYDCYYFTENVGKEGLEFDYKIKEGISSTRNAVKILEYMGYPKTIIDKINNAIANKN
ncbi:MutS family DNA mismatch repair protein [Haloimpatiens sp. FM7330]|uniref:MutS-related protein n=1 Tax=Haloimpatiens sp. FM7330 TaxID=3298610 RepID=UPI00363CDCFD